MTKWEFNEADFSDVDVGLTQRDQFNNDEVGLSDALVREVIQNSSDAPASNGPVKVAFSFATLKGSDRAEYESHLAPLRPHLEACKANTDVIGTGAVRVLLIEDFNTRGLTGRTDDLDEENFRNFWRRHGKTSKSGKQGGRWGLGKLVYSSSSALRVFYGLTIRQGETKPLLMGQAVLTTHQLNGAHYQAHGFWFSQRAANRLQLPIDAPVEVDRFRALMGIRRTTQPGLSLAIPYVSEDITEEGIISGVLANYYFPVLSGKLEVEVGDQLIDRTTFIDVVAKTEASQKTGVPFDFIKELSDRLKAEPDYMAERTIGRQQLDKDCFEAAEVEKMKQAFTRGDLVHARVPVRLCRKGDGEVTSSIELFLRPLPEGGKSFALFARGPIILPGERKYFGGAPAYGAIIANDDEIAAFLGDAENPAHTAWNSHAEKLAANWSNRQATLKAVRYALRDFYNLVADQIETEDTNALIDFFSLADQGASSKGRKRRRTPKPVVNPPLREKGISIRAKAGGFDLIAGPAAEAWTYPRTIRVRVAYDMIGGNPFNHHSRYDFDLNRKDISVVCENAEANAVKANILRLDVQSKDFRLEARGFDLNRDLVVEARAV